MSQNFNGYRGTPHGSPPPLANNDFTGLMGSLISPSPGPATPLQQGFGMPFYNAAAWQNGGHGNYNFNVPFQAAPVNEDAWNQNGGENYMALPREEEEEDEDDSSLMVVDDTEILKNLQNNSRLNQNGGTSNHSQAANHEPIVKFGQPPNLASSSPLALPHPRLSGLTVPAPVLTTKPPMVNDSAARAAELRAKLLAKRPSTTASPRASPAVKKAELPNATQTNPQESNKQINGTPATKVKTEEASKNPAVQATAATKAREKSTRKPQEQPQGKPVKDDEFEHLFAQARNAADSAKSDAKMTNGSHTGRATVEKPVDLPTNDVKMVKPTVSDTRPALQKNQSSSDMSEGEIHSGPSSPIIAPPSPKAVDTKESKLADQEKNEKLMRQNEVNKAYQPLRTSKQPITDPAKTGPKMPDRSKAEPSPSPKLSNKQLKQQAWKQKNGYAGSHDVYPDSRRDREWDRARDPSGRDDERDSRRPSTSQPFANSAQIERDARRRLSDDEIRRQQRMEDNARRAAEYKKNLDAQRMAASKKSPESSKVSSSPKDGRRQENEPRASQTSRKHNERDESTATQLRIDTQIQTVESATGEQDIDTVMLSPAGQMIEGDEDVSDWLELTEYYDLVHRERRLTWFRKKRALDIQKAEVEREEQLEMQERTMLKRAQSVLPANTPPKATRRPSIVHAKMPPPPLPLKEANNVGIKIKDSALSAGLPASQTPTTSLKRQHAEDDLDTRRMQPADKIARTDVNGHAANEKPLTSPASVKGEGSAVRGDRYIPRQGRSRSPGFRRRSLSPRRQRHTRSPSPHGNRNVSIGSGLPRHIRTCHNCGQPGHIVNECTEPRRDGKDWNRPSEYQQWVSPNYRGRNPVAVARGGNRSPHLRGGGNGNRSRYSSIGKTEDGETGNGRENIGGASLKMEDGGQSRR